MDNAIEIQGLHKQFPGFALRDICFDVPKGHICGFVGPNGAGKTTTLKLMMDMMRPDQGSIKLLGKPAGNAEVKQRISVMFDRPHYQESWTALDIEKGLSPFYPLWNTSRFHRYLSDFDLDPQKKFKDFSRGMKMKLAMAVSLSHEAELLLLDEPTGGLDPVARVEILDILQTYMLKENRTILFSTHITSDLERIADLIVYISKGEISFSGEKDALVAAYVVVRGSYLTDEKRTAAIGLREHSAGFECLMKIDDIGGLSGDAVVEKASIDDVVVFMERESRHA